MLSIKNLVKVYETKGGVSVRALDGVNIDFAEKGMVFLLGKSGSGKSTLLNVTGGLDVPTEGEIIVKGKSSKDFIQEDWDSYRNVHWYRHLHPHQHFYQQQTCDGTAAGFLKV